jgi:hypothetical protein
MNGSSRVVDLAPKAARVLEYKQNRILPLLEELNHE